ncbi:g12838 [Coccomyxa viridis]|uniref:G12838 protein n=1 Tax=Coccomyxa viridis TaxID=1274662 RepID=A0ABP1GE13_9CHLO
MAAAAVASQPEALPGISGRDSQKTVSLKDVHILLVDDERLSRVVVGNLLRKCFYQVTEAESGMEALEILRSNAPGTFSLVLTDVMMPDVDGIELLRHVRGVDAWSNLPVIMMSANERTETVFECIRGGAEDYLLKPVTRKEVQHMWQHVWRRQQQNALRVPHMCPEEAEEFLKAHSTNASVPSAPLSMVQASAAALDMGMDRSASACLSEPCSRCASPPARAHSACLPEDAGLGSQEEAQPQDAAQAERHPPGAPAEPSGENDLPPAGSRQPQGARREQRPETVRRGNWHGARAPASTLAAYFARRGSTVRAADSFRIFCGVLSVLKSMHSRGVTVRRVRPSMLRITASGVVMSSTQAPDPEEEALYASPEELLSNGTRATPKSDVYSLGMLFFELFNPSTDSVDRKRALEALRHRILPSHVLRTRPQEAAFVFSLLHPDPANRPTVDSIVHSQLLLALHKSIRSQKTAGDIRAPEAQTAGKGEGPEKTVSPADQQALLQFLRMMRKGKETEGADCMSKLGALEADIQAVTQRLARISSDAPPALPASLQQAMALANSRKRKSCEVLPSSQLVGGPEAKRGHSLDNSRSGTFERELQENWQRVSLAFPALENAYFAQREALLEQHAQQAQQAQQAQRGAEQSGDQPLDALQLDVRKMTEDHISGFSQDLSHFCRHSKLAVKATVQNGNMMHAADMLCSISFDRDDEYFATAGVSRRIKVYAMEDVLDSTTSIHCPRLEMASRSKLSCVCWNSYIKHLLLAADYDGCLSLWDAQSNVCTGNFDDHGKRVWSADFSTTDPMRFVSGGDDCTVRLWSIREEAPTAVIDAKANVCSVQFSPVSSNLLAFGSANYRVYLYDLRQMQVPLAVIGGHKKAVSYVRWMDGTRLISASTDNQLKLWDINSGIVSGVQHDRRPINVLSGHSNERNFVGLSVTPDGYIACGSEDNCVYTYYNTMPAPLCRHSFSSPSEDGQEECDDLQAESRQFVSSVCWSRRSHTLLAANSQGTLKLLELE